MTTNKNDHFNGSFPHVQSPYCRSTIFILPSDATAAQHSYVTHSITISY